MERWLDNNGEIRRGRQTIITDRWLDNNGEIRRRQIMERWQADKLREMSFQVSSFTFWILAIIQICVRNLEINCCWNDLNQKLSIYDESWLGKKNRQIKKKMKIGKRKIWKTYPNKKK